MAVNGGPLPSTQMTEGPMKCIDIPLLLHLGKGGHSQDHTNISTLRTEFSPSSKGPKICSKCKFGSSSAQKTAHYCRVQKKHTAAPWSDTFICITIDESCIDGNGRLIYEEGISFVAKEITSSSPRPQEITAVTPKRSITGSTSAGTTSNTRMTSSLSSLTLLLSERESTLASPFEFQQDIINKSARRATLMPDDQCHLPICSDCKKKKYSVEYCRRHLKHRSLPHTTSYHRMVPLRGGSLPSSKQSPPLYCGRGAEQQTGCNKHLVAFDLTEKIPASRTFMLVISSESLRIEVRTTGRGI